MCLIKAKLTIPRVQCKKMIAENPRKIAELEADLPDWQKLLTGLRKVQPQAARANKLRTEDIPKLESDLQTAITKHADIAAKAEEVGFVAVNASRHH